jgi:hypothetical protein
MSFRSNIQTAVRNVIAIAGETWQYRRLTSGAAASTRTYGTATDVTASISLRSAAEEFDEQRGGWKRIERAQLAISDALAELHQGDQVKDPNAVWWSIEGIVRSDERCGAIIYDIRREITLRAEANRQGGV